MNIKSTVVAIVAVTVMSLLISDSVSADTKSVTVNQGDTLSSIAEANGTDYVRIFNANEQLSSPDIINAGDTVRIPTADEQLPDRYGSYVAAMAAYVAPVSYQTGYTSSAPAAGYYAPAGRTTNYTPTNSAGNTYAWGNCTWYAKERRGDIGNAWGNAGPSWISNAQAAGYNTGSAPAAGAIGVQNGHVVYVESVSGGNVNISEMNYAGGVGKVHTRTASASDFQYIY